MTTTFKNSHLRQCALLLAGLLLVLYIFLIFWQPLEIEDIWWHLSVGRWVFEHHAFPHVDIFSIEEHGIPWILTQATGSLIYYLFYHAGGEIALKIFRSVFFVIICNIYFIYSSRKISLVWLLILLYIAAQAFGFRATLRPDLFNYIFIQLYIIVLLNFHKTHQAKYLLWIPFLSIFWFNLHLGDFIYGTIIILAFLVSEAVSILNNILSYKSQKLPESKTSLWKKFIFLTLALASHFIAFRVNPYGWEGALYPLKAFFDNEFVVRKIIFNRILELQPPTYLLTGRGLVFWVFTILAVICILKNGKNLHPLSILFIFSFFGFIYGRRASTYFTLCCLYLIAETSMAQNWKEKWEQSNLSRKLDAVLSVFLILIILFRLYPYCKQTVFINGNIRPYRQLTEDPYSPQKAVEFLKLNQITGPVLNWQLFGGYLIWTGYPGLRPLYDGRQANLIYYEDYLKLFHDPSIYWADLNKKYGFTVALFDINFHDCAKLIDYLQNRPEWRLAFVSGSTIVFLNKDKLQLPDNIENNIQQFKKATVSSDLLTQMYEASIQVDSTSLEDYFKPPPLYIEPLEEGAALYLIGYKNAGLLKIFEAVKKTQSSKARQALRYALEDYVRSQ